MPPPSTAPGLRIRQLTSPRPPSRLARPSDLARSGPYGTGTSGHSRTAISEASHSPDIQPWQFNNEEKEIASPTELSDRGKLNPPIRPSGGSPQGGSDFATGSGAEEIGDTLYETGHPSFDLLLKGVLPSRAFPAGVQMMPRGGGIAVAPRPALATEQKQYLSGPRYYGQSA